MKEKYNYLKNKYPGSIFFDESLSKYNWFNLGGPAEIFYRPKDEHELLNFLKNEGQIFDNINILGAGSNTLIRDGGVTDLTIKLSSKFSYIKKIKENLIEVGAATLDKKISDFASINSITGMEFLACIPGSLGGAIVMNSGCYNNEISSLIHSINIIDFKGNKKEIKKSELEFFYRGSSLPKHYLIISAILKGKTGNRNEIEKKQLEMIKKKKLTQPSRVKTCGSTFKNPPNEKAWNLIKRSNCENLSVGSAKLSTKHSNFLINEGTASSKEIEDLIKKVKKQVLNVTGVELDLEIKVIGEKN